MKPFIYILYILITLPFSARALESDFLLSKLDSMILNKENYAQDRKLKINELQKRWTNAHTKEEHYWLNKMLYEECFFYNADSASIYADRNLSLAQQLRRDDWVIEWKIKKSFLLAATGLLKEALDMLQGISGEGLPPRLQKEYFEQMIYLYSHLGQFSGESVSISKSYYEKETLYKDSINAIISPDDPLFLWFRGWRCVGQHLPESEEIKNALIGKMEVSNLDTRWDAMHAYVLAHLCLNEGDKDNYVKYMIMSAMADIQISNKDIASLEELAKYMFESGDIDRAYTYINYCLQAALLYPNRVRVVSISAVQDNIQRAYRELSRRQEGRLRIFLILVSILSVVLSAAILYICIQMKYVSRSRTKLKDTNLQLERHVEELSEAHKQLEEVNQQLQSLNLQLKDTNEQLFESNHVKEEYIGYIFNICSNYISKLEDYRKNIQRKLKVGQLEDIQKLTASSTLANNELKEFYQNFDKIFLRLYPTFVDDFNTLLRPDERIDLKEGELLNTELRIQALIRLGITDSVKIAEFLHCSAQTIYNNRLRTRNKAAISKDDFIKAVKKLGRYKS